MQSYFYWQGPGWYAPIQRTVDHEQFVEYYCLDAGQAWYNDANEEARDRHLGTPVWYDRLPDDALALD